MTRGNTLSDENCSVVHRQRKDGLIEYRPSVLPKTCPKERIEQIDSVSWVREHYPEYAALMLHPVNEGAIPVQYRVDLYKQGQLPGASDILFLKSGARWPKAAIEIKRIKGGHASEDQVKFLLAVKADGGYTAIARGFEAFKVAFFEYIGG